MIKAIKIKRYKSIESLDISLGRINVFIGENGSGKSNILEAIALCGAAEARKLDNEFLISRGVRVTKPSFMHPAFTLSSLEQPISISVIDDENNKKSFEIYTNNEPYPQWRSNVSEGPGDDLNVEELSEIIEEYTSKSVENREDFIRFATAFTKFVEDATSSRAQASFNEKSLVIDESSGKNFAEYWFSRKSNPRFFGAEEVNFRNTMHDSLARFLVYSPENSSLRTFEREGQVEPLGINGEGLLKLLTIISSEKNKAQLKSIKDSLSLLGWFGDFRLVDDPNFSQRIIEIRDKFLHKKHNYFDQKSANEGFLFLLFYFTLFESNLTPKFFAIDNIDASLNPKLCEKLIKELSRKAVQNDKQVIMTTHNPAVLDGLNLDDIEQKLFVVYRGRKGQTMIRNVEKQSSSDGGKMLRLSEAFIQGALGGLPKHF